jgi:Domain of unknown function (DUF4920)
MKILLVVAAAVTLLPAADIKLGKPLVVPEAVPIATLLAHPDDYTGKTVQVKGKITEVCQAMGCWMELANQDGQKIRIKVNDGEVEFPKDSAGGTAVAEGKFTKIVLTREQAVARAKEEAEEKGEPFDPSSVKSGATIYQVQGSGAVIVSN